ncbi:MAG: GspE/PulE family protein [bacterium]|jgi:type IV pilus assembly protein PilB
MPDVHHNELILQLLESHGLVTPEQLQEISEEHQRSGKPVRDIIINIDVCPEDTLLKMIAESLGTRVVNLAATDIPPEVVHSISASVARMYMVVPVERGINSVTLATCDLMSPATMDELAFVLTKDVSLVMAREEDIRAHVNQLYGDESTSVSDMLNALESEIDQADKYLELNTTQEDTRGIEEAAGSAPVIRFVNLMLYQAVQDRASDIHFEPFENEFKIRYRVDGALYEMAPPPKRLAIPVISRLKVMSGLNIAERRLPQDGRIQLTIGGRQIDFRVSCLPTQFGESVVLRVLDRGVVSLDLDNLGMPDDILKKLLLDLDKPNGIIVVTGPTGSGKTTTLYSALRRLNTTESKLLTAEDPVEYEIDGIIQVPVNDAIGNTFERVLRAFLRQDPDVLMIGEIRDLTTAHIAIHASLTGHLVFSTLHTNDAAGAVTRLIDMEVEPYLISSTMEAVVGQRLVRKVCDSCKTAFKPEDKMLERLGLTRQDVGEQNFYYGTGCGQCNNTGYKGRKGIYEYLSISDPIRELINQRQPTLVIRDKAIQLGMRTLRQDGIKNILDGYTTVEEVLRYT